MVSEWEKLEKVPKDELIIELIHWRNLYGTLRVEQEESCVWPYVEPLGRESEGWIIAGQVTSREWAERIAKYAASRTEKTEFSPTDLMDYGLDEDQSYEICEELVERNELQMPPGTVYRNGDLE